MSLIGSMIKTNKASNLSQEEIKKLPNANNILLKDFAYGLYTGYQKILEENQNQEKLSENKDEESEIPF